jgi:hypothetical protein
MLIATKQLGLLAFLSVLTIFASPELGFPCLCAYIPAWFEAYTVLA